MAQTSESTSCISPVARFMCRKKIIRRVVLRQYLIHRPLLSNKIARYAAGQTFAIRPSAHVVRRIAQQKHSVKRSIRQGLLCARGTADDLRPNVIFCHENLLACSQCRKVLVQIFGEDGHLANKMSKLTLSRRSEMHVYSLGRALSTSNS